MAHTIAVLSSAFNPPTIGHKSILERLSFFDKVLVIPVQADSRGRQFLDYDLRRSMLEVFVKDIDLPNVEVCAVEHEIDDAGGHVRTSDLIEHLSSLYPESEITFAIGPDKMKKFPSIRGNDDLLGRINILVCAERSDVRSEFVREKAFRNVDISNDTTESVVQMITEKALYDDMNDNWLV